MYKFPSPVLKVQYHPRKKNLFLVCPMKHAAVLLDTEGSHKKVPLGEDVSSQYHNINFNELLTLYQIKSNIKINIVLNYSLI